MLGLLCIKVRFGFCFLPILTDLNDVPIEVAIDVTIRVTINGVWNSSGRTGNSSRTVKETDWCLLILVSVNDCPSECADGEISDSATYRTSRDTTPTNLNRGTTINLNP